MKFLVNVLGVETEIDYDIATALNQDEQTTLLTAISNNTLTLDSNIDTVNTNLVSILNKLIASPSTEAKQDSQITELQALKTRLDSLLLKDFSTEATLSLIKANQTNSTHITKIAGSDGTIASVNLSGALKVEATTDLDQPLTDTQLRATPVPVSGTFWQATQPVSFTWSGLTDTQLRATPVAVSGTVTANTGLTQPLTDTQLRASPVPISGTVTANTGLTQPLTDTELRATPVPISGTVTANTGLTQPLTDVQLRATPVAVSGTFYQATQPVSFTWSGLTDTELRASPVPISGTVTANTGLTQPLTDTQLRATPVPASLSSLPALATGSNIIGQVSIDQTTDGTTNLVSAKQNGDWTVYSNSQSIVGDTIVVERDNQIEMPFHTAIDTDVCTSNVTGSGTAAVSNAILRLRTGAANSSAEIISLNPVGYKAGNEMYYEFTVVFSAATTLLEEEIGGRNSAGTVKLRLYRSDNVVNFSIIDPVDGNTTVAQSSWNSDKLDGGVNSRYTYNGVVEAKDWTKGGLFRFRYAWYGFANIILETLTPDGKWIDCHVHKIMNQSASTHLATPELYPYAKITSAVGGADYSMYTGCMAAGITNGKYKLNSSISDSTLAGVTRSVITGRSSTGGGTFYNVKVNPSGTLEVSGTVAATQSGTWNIGSITTLPSLVAGTALIGKVGIDQATPGTTNAVAVQPISLTATDKSGTITTGGTAQNAIASNASRKGWIIQNISDTDMYVCDSTTATTGKFLIKANGGVARSDGNNVVTGNISLLCATTGKAFAATEYT